MNGNAGGGHPCIPLAYSHQSGREIGFEHDSNLLLVGGARSGKFRDILCKILLTWPHSVICLDGGKGQAPAVTGWYRKHVLKQPVHVLMPYEDYRLKGRLPVSSRFNPQADIKPDDDNAATRCDGLAEVFCGYQRGTHHGNDYFEKGGNFAVSGVMGGLIAGPFEDCDKTPEKLRAIITNPEAFFEFARMIVDHDVPAWVKERLRRFTADKIEQNREARDCLSTADVNTAYWSDPALIRNSAANDIDWLRLTEEPGTVYIVPSAEQLEGPGTGWLRTVIQTALFALRKSRKRVPLLLVLDEMHTLGGMPIIATSYALGGMGYQILGVYQDLNQARNAWGEQRWRTFCGNAGCLMVMGVREDNFTAGEISKLCGFTEERTENLNLNWSPGMDGEQPNITRSKSQYRRDVMLPQEIMGRGERGLRDNEVLIFADGQMVRAERRPYWETCPGKYSPDPFHLDL